MEKWSRIEDINTTQLGLLRDLQKDPTSSSQFPYQPPPITQNEVHPNHALQNLPSNNYQNAEPNLLSGSQQIPFQPQPSLHLPFESTKLGGNFGKIDTSTLLNTQPQAPILPGVPPPKEIFTRLHEDPQCEKRVVKLFMQFAKDYFHSAHYTDSKKGEPHTETWSEFVVSFANQSVSHLFVRKLSDLLFQTQIEAADSSDEDERRRSKKKKRTSERMVCEQEACNTFLRPGFNYPGEAFGRFCRVHKKRGMVKAPTEQKQESHHCLHISCKRGATLGYPAQSEAKMCHEHKLPGMVVKSRGKNCVHPGCSKTALFNKDSEKVKKYCSDHKTAGMVKISAAGKLCEFPNCHKQPSHNFPGHKRKRFCGQHKLDGMENKRSKACGIQGCNNRAYFNYKGLPRKFCKEHKAKGMTNVNRKLCEEPLCIETATYAEDSQKRPQYCEHHKTDTMVCRYVAEKRTCEQPGCEVYAGYRYKTDLKPRFCKTHRLEGMVSHAMVRKCIAPQCERGATYNFEGQTTPHYCSVHMLDGMRNVKRKTKNPHTCEAEGCFVTPGFNYDGLPRGRFCARHKLKNMRNITIKRCEEAGCLKEPCFNYPGERKGRLCGEHRLGGMVDVKTKKCEHPTCQKHPFFNYPGLTSRRFCTSHKLEGMVSVRDPKNKRRYNNNPAGLSGGPGSSTNLNVGGMNMNMGGTSGLSNLGLTGLQPSPPPPLNLRFDMMNRPRQLYDGL